MSTTTIYDHLPFWQNPLRIQSGHLPARARFAATETVSLNGEWLFRGANSDAESQADYHATYKYYPEHLWQKMPVPGHWERNGFGSPH